MNLSNYINFLNVIPLIIVAYIFIKNRKIKLKSKKIDWIKYFSNPIEYYRINIKSYNKRDFVKSGFIYGITYLITKSIVKNKIESLDIIIDILIAPFYGIISLSMIASILFLLGKLFRGKGSLRNVLYGVSIANISSITYLMIITICSVIQKIYKIDITILATILGLCSIIYTIIVTIYIFSDIQNWSVKKTLIIFLVILVILCAIFYLYVDKLNLGFNGKVIQIKGLNLFKGMRE